MPIAEMVQEGRGGARRAKSLLARDFVSGAVLGALAWVAVAELGFPRLLHLSDMSGLAPAALLGALLGVSRLRVILWVGSAAVIGLLAIVAFTPAVVSPAQALVRSDPMPSPPLTLDAVVILSGGITREGVVGPDGTERLISGLRLAKATGTAAIVTTRVRHPADANVSSDEDQKKLVELAGFGARHFIVADVFSTRDEAMRVRDLARRQEWARVAVVTSPAHSRRACGTFEKVGLRVTCVPAESRGVAFRTIASPDDRLRAFSLWIYEMAGTLKYRLEGWLP